MKDWLKNTSRAVWASVVWAAGELTVFFLGAAAIFLVGAFPGSVCGECTEWDWGKLIASGFFVGLGMWSRWLHQTFSKEPDSDK